MEIIQKAEACSISPILAGIADPRICRGQCHIAMIIYSPSLATKQVVSSCYKCGCLCAGTVKWNWFELFFLSGWKMIFCWTDPNVKILSDSSAQHMTGYGFILQLTDNHYSGKIIQIILLRQCLTSLNLLERVFSCQSHKLSFLLIILSIKIVIWCFFFFQNYYSNFLNWGWDLEGYIIKFW